MCVLELIGFARENKRPTGDFCDREDVGHKETSTQKEDWADQHRPTPKDLRMSHSLQHLRLCAKSLAAEWLSSLFTTNGVWLYWIKASSSVPLSVKHRD